MPAYHVCSQYAKCGGWEFVRNHKTHCRIATCKSKLLVPTPAQRHQSGERAVRAHSAQHSAASDMSTTTPSELLAPHLTALEAKFPGLSKHVQEVLDPVPEPAPAAKLHTAQTLCQQALKNMSHAEAEVASLDQHCGELAKEFREKIAELSTAQEALCVARKEYDKAARVAQAEVQKSKSDIADPSETSHFSEMFAKLSHAQLEQMAAALAAAVHAAKPNKSGTVTPTQGIAPSSPNAAPRPEPNAFLGNDGVPLGPDGKATPIVHAKPVEPASQMEVDGYVEEFPPLGKPEPIAPGRTTSRSPRRQSEKSDKSDKASDGARSRVSSHAGLVSPKPKSAKVAEYAETATQLEASLANSASSLVAAP